MPHIKLFMAPVRWNQMLLLCHRGRAVTRLKHGRPWLRGGKDFMEQAWTLPGCKQSTGCHDTRFHVTFSCECSDRGRWFSRLVQMWAKPRVLLAVHPPCAGVALYPTLTFVVMARRWPFCPRHALVLNTNAMVLCARHSWEQAVLFLAKSPQLHISNPGPMGN